MNKNQIRDIADDAVREGIAIEKGCKSSARWSLFQDVCTFVAVIAVALVLIFHVIVPLNAWIDRVSDTGTHVLYSCERESQEIMIPGNYYLHEKYWSTTPCKDVK